MKKIITLLVIASAFFASCEADSTANVSSITNYPLLKLKGASPVFVVQGGSYADPGVDATENGVAIQATTTGIGNYRGTTSIDTNKSDFYSQTYTATNKDGYKASVSRDVFIYKNGDLVNSIEGLYTCTVSRNGVTPSNAYRDIKYILIWKNTDGTYQISDAFGGWYHFGRAIGISSITPGGKINAVNIAANNFTFPETLTNSYFGGTATITGLTVNPVTKKLVLDCTWVTAAPSTTYNFVSTLTQVQP
jgi:hypothetical protein